ncbi:MAG: MJ1477/TM1410 family putative glycoside hydrolase [Promethearchaeota archaeon]
MIQSKFKFLRWTKENHSKLKIIFLITIVIIGTSLGVLLTLYSLINFKRPKFELADRQIDDFAYWINDIDKKQIRDSKYDLIIIDYSADGSEDEEFTDDDLDYMKSSGDEKKLLISYISIGEAEDYRYYWEDSWDSDEDGIPDSGAPAWLDEENPDWGGNYKVRYWMQGWQDIIYDYLDRIIDAEFDGIYMDLIDAYEYYEDDIPISDWLMIDFVSNISDYVKSDQGKDFLVFVQNGDNLLKNSTYLDHIDGIGREDLFFDDDDPTDEEDRVKSIKNLNKALEEEKAVLIIDYPTNWINNYEFYKNCADNGFLGYATNRELDRLYEYWYFPAT